MDDYNSNNPFGEEDYTKQPNANPYNNPPDQNAQQNPYNKPEYSNEKFTLNPSDGEYYSTQRNDYDPYNQPAVPRNQSQNDYSNPGQNYTPYNAPNQAYNPYGQPTYGYKPPSSGMATASMVLGIISIVLWLFMFLFPPLFLMPIIGLILGIVHKAKRLPTGKGTSTAGIVTSAIALALCLIFFILIIALMLNGSDFIRSIMQGIKDTSPQQYEQLYEQYYDMFPEWFSGISAMLGAFFR